MVKKPLVSKVPINGVADLKGVKIRSPEGLAADVFRRAGVSFINFSEVYTSLEKGIVLMLQMRQFTLIIQQVCFTK